MYADDIVIVAEHREELQGALEEWNDMFMKHGLKDEPAQGRSDVGWEIALRGVKYRAGRERH